MSIAFSILSALKLVNKIVITMRIMQSKLITISLIIVLAASSCVSMQQFKELETKNQKCSEERDNLVAENELLNVENKEISAKLERIEPQLEQLIADSARKSEELNALNARYQLLLEQYATLENTQKTMIDGNVKETRQLLQELQTAQADLAKKQTELVNLENELNAKRLELDQRNARLIELESMIQRKDSVVRVLKEKVSDALLGFEGQGLQVTQKNGKVYVSLDEQLLFKTGSTDVDPKGKTALKKLAVVLEQNPDINIMIEGHTDDVPFVAGSAIKDNWDLSVMRATSVTRILLEGSSIDPKRITASGRGEYLPVEKGKNPEARQKNRRTEIILTPKLDELYDILNM
jgi:chemotaxis protein MotB